MSSNLAGGGERGRREIGVAVRSLVRGTIPFTKLKSFVFLIISLCPETGEVSDFREYDRVFNPSPEVRAMKNSLHLRTRLPVRPSSANLGGPATLQYAGPIDRRAPAPMERRPVTTVAVGREAPSLLSILGCTLAFEYIRKGVRRRTRTGLTVDAFLLERLLKSGDPSMSEAFMPVEDQHCIVEVWADDLSSPEVLTAFIQHLSPYVTWHSQSARRR